MDIDKDSFFSEIVGQFIEQYCNIGPDQNVRDSALFPKFRGYWERVTNGEKHPALLGQFRVELVRRGYRSSDGKWPSWYGIGLRKKKRANKADASNRAVQHVTQTEMAPLVDPGQHISAQAARQTMFDVMIGPRLH